MKVYFFLRHSRKNSKGLCPIVCRVARSHDDRDDFRTKMFIEPSRWDSVRGLPIDNTESILTRLNNISGKLYRLIAINDEASPTDIVNEYRNPPEAKPDSIRDIVTEMHAKKVIPEQTKIRMEPSIKLWLKFTRNLSVTKTTQEHVEGFYNHIIESQSPHTVDKKLSYIKRIFTYAKANDYIKQSPFTNYKFPATPKLDPTRLSEQELMTIAKKGFEISRLEYIRDLFLFQCWTGFSYKDIFQFSAQYIVTHGSSQYIDGKRMKNGQQFFLPFFPEAERLAAKYNYHFKSISNQRYNSYLKEIADLCKIDKRFTTHVGRKTFAQRMIDQGYSAESVSKMLGHESFDMTQKHYARISERRIYLEHEKVIAA